MEQDTRVIASGNLAGQRRNVGGLLGQLALLEVEPAHALRLLTDVGLPARALEEPDFPLSLAQELRACYNLVEWLVPERSPTTEFFTNRDKMGIEGLGAVGMAMRHADTALEALKVCLDFPELTWGHSRMIVRIENEQQIFSFAMDRPNWPEADPAIIDELLAYGACLDLVGSLRNIEDITGGRLPVMIKLPFSQPKDWAAAEPGLPCPVLFDAEEASLAYPHAIQDMPLPRANPLVYRSFVAIAKTLSQMLAEDISLAEQVTRWLWAYTPPLRRGEIASQLAVSERSLVRQLGEEGTSYAQLLAKVQSERAMNFLRKPGLSVTEVGYRLGYSEPAAFTRAFSKWTGVSPLQWRKQSITA